MGRGFKIGKKNFYSAWYLGFNNRTKDYSEEIRYGLEFGTSFFKNKSWLIGRVRGVESLKNGATAETVTSNSIFANNTEYTSVSIEFNQYFLKEWGLSMSADFAVRGEIIAAAPSFSFGVFWDLTK